LLFEAYSFTDPDVIDRWRGTWPSWRRAVRPIGATAWWLGVVDGFIFDHGGPTYIRIILGAVMTTCVAIGVYSYLRAGRELGLRHRFAQSAIPA
jgi:hypothetical protein